MDKGLKINKAVKCDLCSITLNSEQQAKQHYSGKNHLKKLRQTGSGNGSTSIFAAPEQVPQPQPAVPAWTSPTVAAAPKPLPSVSQSLKPISQPGTRVTVPEVSEPTATTLASNAQSKLDPVSQAVYDNVLGKLPTKRKKDIPCGVCDMVFNSDAQATAHFAGSRHNKKQKLVEVSEEDAGVISTKTWGALFHCSKCNVTLNSEAQLDDHKQGAKHKKLLAATSTSTGNPCKVQNTLSWGEVPGKQSGWFHCTTCNISVATAISLRQHIAGEGHRAKILLAKDEQADHMEKETAQ